LRFLGLGLVTLYFDVFFKLALLTGFGRRACCGGSLLDVVLVNILIKLRPLGRRLFVWSAIFLETG
jgi:hypothetical protein